MPTNFEAHAIEESTFIITASFTDEDGNAVAPDTAIWTLTDKDGTVINSRSNVTITNPTNSEDIVLSGDDLALQIGESNIAIRILTVEATYDSDAGSDLPLKESVEFIIDNLLKIT